jgi:hypothetical protein
MFYLESLNKEDKDSSLLNREIKLSSGMDLIWSWYGVGIKPDISHNEKIRIFFRDEVFATLSF